MVEYQVNRPAFLVWQHSPFGAAQCIGSKVNEGGGKRGEQSAIITRSIKRLSDEGKKEGCLAAAPNAHDHTHAALSNKVPKKKGKLRFIPVFLISLFASVEKPRTTILGPNCTNDIVRG